MLKFTSGLKICHEVTVCNSVMFYVNLLSVFLKVYNKLVVSKCVTKHINLYFLQLYYLIITNGSVYFTIKNLFFIRFLIT
jgi:hypothetical protein